MPLYIIERTFADQLELAKDGTDAVQAVNMQEEGRWLLSCLPADKKTTYCLYESPGLEAIRTAAETAGLAEDLVTKVMEVREQFA